MPGHPVISLEEEKIQQDRERKTIEISKDLLLKHMGRTMVNH